MKSLLVIGYVWPEPGSSAAGARMMQLLEFFLGEGYQVTFATTATETEFMAGLSDLGIHSVKIELNNSSFDIFIKKLQPTVVLFDRFMMEEQFGWRVSEACPRTLRILDTEDLHFFRKARQQAFREGIDVTPAVLQSETAKREVASIYRCDLTLIISEVEMELLMKVFNIPANLLHYLPFMIKTPSSAEIEDLPGFEDRRHFVSIGNFRHEPNWDGVQNLKQHIWPLIRKELPEAEIHIYGAYATEKVNQLHQPQTGFLIRGRAAFSEKVIKQARVLLAPLRFGAGLKGKFIDAMQTGTPAITSSVGAEGMASESEWPGQIKDDAEDFAMAAVELHQNKAAWQSARNKGFAVLTEYFAKDEHEQRFRKIVESLKKDLEKHRESNFTGAMLLQHQLNSTRYLSKYIEMKNQCEQLRGD